jgi:hypothetical protein
MKHLLIFVLLLPVLAFGQTAYEIPFASKGNTVELVVENTTSLTSSHIIE